MRKILIVIIALTAIFIPNSVRTATLDPHSSEYRFTYDLIDESKGKEFKHQFDSLVKVMYDYNLEFNRLYEEALDSLGHFADLDSIYKYMYGPDYKMGSPYSGEMPREYEQRILTLLEELYDYTIKGMPYHPGGSLPPNSYFVAPLYEMYLYDAPDIDADWLYDKWLKVLRPSVENDWSFVYSVELDIMQSIADKKGYSGRDGTPLIILFEADSDLDSDYNVVQELFPDSKWIECIKKVFCYDKSDDFRGILKHKD